MFSPVVLEAYDDIFASSPVLEESETSSELEMPHTAPISTLPDETSELNSDYDSDSPIKRHWYLHTRQWQYQQAMSTSKLLSESLQLKALLSPSLTHRPGKATDKIPEINVDVEAIEVVESTA